MPDDEIKPEADQVVITADEEKALDESINADIAKVKAENVTETIPPTVKTSTETPPAEEVPPEKTPETQTEEQPALVDFKEPPKKGKFESDESYSMRLNLFDLIKQRKEAQTPAEKDAIQSQMDAIRTEIREIATSKPSLQKTNDGVTPSQTDSQGKPLSQADIDALIDQRLLNRQQQLDIRSVSDSFFTKHPEFKDQDVRAVFIEFFDSNYKIEGKTPKEAAAVLELAHQAMFRPNESVQERVIKAAGVQDRVNAMQFPGGTIVKSAISPADQKAIDEIVATGMSEEKARQLILD